MKTISHPTHTFIYRDMEVEPSELGSLLDGWETRYTAHGRRYFVDHINRTTQFTGKLGGMLSTSLLVLKLESSPHQIHGFQHTWLSGC